MEGPNPTTGAPRDPDLEPDRQTVLLVEDAEADRDVYGGLLWYNGFNVVHAPDGERGLELARQVRPDLLLLDVRLPGRLSGLDVAATLRSEGFEVPMIALSAVPREEAGSAVERSGVTCYLEKPIDPFVVVREVMRHVGEARRRS